MFFQGINLSGLESSSVTTRGKNGFNYKAPSSSHYDYWFGEGTGGGETAMNIVRLPFRWERLQADLYGELDQGYLKLIKDQVAFAAEKGADIILDVHNYGAYTKLNSDGTETEFYIGSEDVPAEAFNDLWGKLAAEFQNEDHVVLGLMNEPTNHFSGQEWADIAQGAIDTIREVGVTNKILVPGVFWSSAEFWNTNGNSEALAGITDPLDNITFETHQYFDVNGGGFSHTVTDDAVSRLYAVTEWARSTGNKILLGEFGVSLNDPEISEQNAALMEDVIQFMASNSDVWEGWTAWGAGEHWHNDYHFKLTYDSRTGAEQDEAVFLKSMAEMSLETIEAGPVEVAISIDNNYSYEAEKLTLSGGYIAAAIQDASAGGGVLSYGGEGTVSLEFAGKTGIYQLQTDYFDESDGVSEFKISVNGIEVESFAADQDFHNLLRNSQNLTSHLTGDLYLTAGDVVSVSGTRHLGELAAIDALHLLGQETTLDPSVPTETLWSDTAQEIPTMRFFEAEDLTLSGAYQSVATQGASGGHAVLSHSGEGTISLEFAGSTGYYKLKTDYFDETDGLSTFKIAVNGVEVENFVADQDFHNILRTSQNLTSHLSDNIYLETGDVLSVSGVRHKGELAAIDALHLITERNGYGKAGVALTGVTDDDFSDYDFRQNDGSAVVTASTDGRGVSIEGNGWTAIDIDYDFTEDTLVSVNMTIKELGEIHGIAFDTDHNMSVNDSFQFAGTQNYDFDLKADINLDVARNFTFHAGDYFTGHRTVMGFINDDDNASDGVAHALFDNIEIYELTNTIYTGSGDDIVTGTANAEYLYGGAGADTFNIDGTHLGLADKIMDFNVLEGDKLDFSHLADDLGVNIDLILENVSLVTDKKGGAALLLNEGAVTGTGNNVSTLALFDNGVQNVSITQIV